MAYVGKTSQAAMLQAFLFWNFVNSTRHIAKRLKTSHEQFSAYWMATRLRYESWIANGSPMPLGIPSLRIKNASVIGDIFGGVIIVVLGSSLFGTVANFTTGITIAHTGFTPNPHVTQSIGFVPIIQLIPFVFGAMVLLMVFALFEKHLPGGL